MFDHETSEKMWTFYAVIVFVYTVSNKIPNNRNKTSPAA